MATRLFSSLRLPNVLVSNNIPKLNCYAWTVIGVQSKTMLNQT